MNWNRRLQYIQMIALVFIVRAPARNRVGGVSNDLRNLRLKEVKSIQQNISIVKQAGQGITLRQAFNDLTRLLLMTMAMIMAMAITMTILEKGDFGEFGDW